MTVAELISQLDQLDHTEKMQILDHLIEGLEEEGADEADDAHWDESLARSQDLLSSMAARTRQNRDKGLNQELDPDNL